MVQFALRDLADPELDHFERLQLERDPSVCPTTLELRYLRASRIVHPDLQQARNGNGQSTSSNSEGAESTVFDRDAVQAEPPRCPVELAIEASALLNEAQRVLAHPWERYPYLAELLVPGVMEATKQLDPSFLMQAMELGETVDEARGNPEATRAQKREIEGELVGYAHEVERLLRSGSSNGSEDDVRQAARLCHEAKYYRRALEILEREETGPLPE